MIAMPLQAALRAHQAGDIATAEAGYRAVLKNDPQQVDALYLLGVLLNTSGRHTDAIAPLQQAAQLRPAFAEGTAQLALALNIVGRKEEALVTLFNAIGEGRGSAPLRQLLATLLQDVMLHTGSPLVIQVLAELCADSEVPTQMLSGAIWGLAKGRAEFATVQQAARLATVPTAAQRSAAVALMADPLIQLALPRMVVVDADAEQVLTYIRRYCVDPDGTPLLDANALTMMCTLAAQCFNTEYAWAESAGETARVEALKDALDSVLADDHVNPVEYVEQLAQYALYAPLHTLKHWRRLLAVPPQQWPPAMALLILTQIVHYDTELQIADAVPTLTPITDDTSERVREQYEANPYPRWLSLQQPIQTTTAAFIRSLRPELTHDVATTHILVAGGGTGQQPLHLARSFPASTITTVDLSRRSLAYAARMADELNINNVAFWHGDLLQLPEEHQEWAIVSCSGVLHHLHDPMAGWAKLAAQLGPHSVMKIGLYSRSARTAVEAARAVALAHGCTADTNGIRALRQHIMALPADHAARAVLASRDFYSVSGCRDLILHTQECTFTIPEIAACLEQLNLQFLGFQITQPVQARFHAEHPQANPQRDLMAWHEFELRHPDTFAGMYQFWCGYATS
jgi:SAM-dependent methyltransferase